MFLSTALAAALALADFPLVLNDGSVLRVVSTPRVENGLAVARGVTTVHEMSMRVGEIAVAATFDGVFGLVVALVIAEYSLSRSPTAFTR